MTLERKLNADSSCMTLNDPDVLAEKEHYLLNNKMKNMYGLTTKMKTSSRNLHSNVTSKSQLKTVSHVPHWAKAEEADEMSNYKLKGVLTPKLKTKIGKFGKRNNSSITQQNTSSFNVNAVKPLIEEKSIKMNLHNH